MNGDPGNGCLVEARWDAARGLPTDEQKGCQVATKAAQASCLLCVPEAVQEAKRCCQKQRPFPCRRSCKHELQLSNGLQGGLMLCWSL